MASLSKYKAQDHERAGKRFQSATLVAYRIRTVCPEIGRCSHFSRALNISMAEKTLAFANGTPVAPGTLGEPMGSGSVNVFLLSPKQRLASILESCGDSVTLHRSAAFQDALDNLTRRRVDILCLDGDHRGTSAFLRRVRLRQLVKCYFVICLTNRNSVQRWFEAEGVQYIASQSDAAVQLPHLLKFCIGLLRMERRQKTRVAVLVPAVVSDAKTEARFPGTITEMSESGCRLMTEKPLEVSAEVNLSLLMQSGVSIAASATVIWSDAVGQAGLAFTYIAPAQYLDYRGCLADLSAGRSLSISSKDGNPAESKPISAEALPATAAHTFGEF